MNNGYGPEDPGCRALLALLRTADAVWNASRAFFTPWNISPSQFNVLNVLVGQPSGMSQTDLSRQLIMNRSNVTGLIDRLEARGLVARKEAELDRRAYRVVLTKEGEALLGKILPRYYEAAQRLWSVVPRNRLEITLAALNAVAGNAELTAQNLCSVPDSPGREKESERHAGDPHHD